MNVPPEIDALFRQALNIHQRGSVTHAKTMYEQILARQPAHFDCCHLLGVAHMQTGSPERAADLISRALTINPESADAHFNLAHALRALGRIDEAIASVGRAIGLRPGFAEYHLERGIMLQAADSLPQALACFEEALRLDPAFADSHRRRAGALMKLNRLEDALASCDEAIRLAPRSAEAHSLKGNILGKLDRLEEALGSHDMAIRLNPKSADAYRQRGRILGALKRLEESAASYNKAVELNPDHAETSIDLAANLRKLERHEKVLASCDRAIQLKPEYADAHRWRGYALGKLNFMDEALESFERAISLEKDNGPARLGRAWLHARCERWDLARADCEVVINRDEMNESAWLRLALLPEGYLPAERAAEILNHRADLVKGDGLASQLFVKSNLLRHLQRYRESFEILKQANDLRLAEISQPDGWRHHLDKLLQSAQTWRPTRTSDAPKKGAKLLVVLGPSRSGKSTLERLLSGNKSFKRGFEGRAAGPARRHLEQIPVREGYPHVSSAKVQQQVFAALFPLRPEEMLGGGHEVATITNPFLLAATPLIFDLYPRSYFIFLQRETIDNAAEIYARDYAHECAFSYSARTALDYVELYQQASDMLAKKMGDRAVRISYEDLLVSPDIVLTSIYGMLGLEPPVNPTAAGEARDTRSVYREHFAALCAEQGITIEG